MFSGMTGNFKRSLLSISLYLLVSLGLSLLFALQTMAVAVRVGMPANFLDNWFPNLYTWAPWGILSFFVLGFARRHPLELRSLKTTLPRHILALLLFSLLHNILASIIFFAWTGTEATKMAEYFLTMWVKTLHFNLLVYALLVSLSQIKETVRKNQRERLRAVRLEADLAHARLEVLRARLNPHFLFNTLHSIQALVRRDPQTAEAMLARVGDLLRRTLDTADENEVTLRDELEIVEIYLDIQGIRFRERLRSAFHIDPQTLDCLVPTLILQPLVENAVRHGITPRSEGGVLSVVSEAAERRLRILIQDDGPGVPRDAAALFDKGTGLNNTRERLRHHFPDDFRLTLRNAEGGGAQVLLDIPCRKPAGQEPSF